MQRHADDQMAIINLPLYYHAHGTVKGRRKASPITVQELLPVEIEETVAELKIPVPGRDALIADGRFWLPTQIDLSTPITSVKQIDTWSANQTVSWDSGAKRRMSGGLQNPISPVEIVRFGMTKDCLTLPVGSDLTGHLKQIEWTDRDRAVGLALEYASALRFVDGMLCTARLEPVITAGARFNVGVRYVAFHDIFTNERHTIDELYKGLSASRGAAHHSMINPTEEEWSDLVGWHGNLNVGIALTLNEATKTLTYRTMHEIAEWRLRDDDWAQLRIAAPPRALTAAHELASLWKTMEDCVRPDFDRADLDRILQGLREMRSMNNPRFTELVAPIVQAIGRVEETLAIMDAGRRNNMRRDDVEALGRMVL